MSQCSAAGKGSTPTSNSAGKSRSGSAQSSSSRPGSGQKSTPGSAGSRHSGSAGTRPAGSAGSRHSGSAGSRPSGSAGSRLSGSAGSRPSGSAGSRPSGSAGNKKLSDRLNPKTVDHFDSSTKSATAFATLYNSGGIPCILLHGSVKHKLGWSPSVEQVPVDPLLITLAEGIRETIHPYMFVARHGFRELLQVPGVEEQVLTILPKLIPPIRAALGHGDLSVFEAGLNALTQLSNVVGSTLNSHLKSLLVSVSKHSMDKKYKEQITDSLQQLEINGGKEALLHIKARVPTYQSVCS